MQRALGSAIWTFVVIMLVGVITYALALFLLRDKFFLDNVKNFLRMFRERFAKGKAVSPEPKLPQNESLQNSLQSSEDTTQNNLDLESSEDQNVQK